MTEPGRAEESAGEESAVGDSAEQSDTSLAEGEGEAAQQAVGDSAEQSDTSLAEGEGEAAQQAAGDGPEQPDTSLAESQGEATQQAPSAEEQPADTSAAQQRGGKKGLLVGLGSGALVGIIVGLAFAGFVKPTFLVGPGKPDDKASEITAALASKNAGDLAKASCRSPDGKLSQQLPPQALQLIQSAKQSGPPQELLDSQALTPVDLTVSQQGQTQTIPIDVVLGVTNGEWCMTGISQRQQ
jgi:hypothetical protein